MDPIPSLPQVFSSRPKNVMPSVAFLRFLFGMVDWLQLACTSGVKDLQWEDAKWTTRPNIANVPLAKESGISKVQSVVLGTTDRTPQKSRSKEKSEGNGHFCASVVAQNIRTLTQSIPRSRQSITKTTMGRSEKSGSSKETVESAKKPKAKHSPGDAKKKSSGLDEIDSLFAEQKKS